MKEEFIPLEGLHSYPIGSSGYNPINIRMDCEFMYADKVDGARHNMPSHVM